MIYFLLKNRYFLFGYFHLFFNKTFQGEVVNKNNWQSALYRKIGSKSRPTGIIHSQENSIKNMLKMAKVLFGLNLVDHPPTHRRSTWRKLVSSQRKKAIMACFRMAPLHSVPRHRAMNMFLHTYRELWLNAEEDTRARLIEHLCVSYSSECKCNILLM
jgi:ryanodine receptor 2